MCCFLPASRLWPVASALRRRGWPYSGEVSGHSCRPRGCRSTAPPRSGTPPHGMFTESARGRLLAGLRQSASLLRWSEQPYGKFPESWPDRAGWTRVLLPSRCRRCGLGIQDDENPRCATSPEWLLLGWYFTRGENSCESIASADTFLQISVKRSTERRCLWTHGWSEINDSAGRGVGLFWYESSCGVLAILHRVSGSPLREWATWRRDARRTGTRRLKLRGGCPGRSRRELDGISFDV
jgi:hypothetical protein